MDTNVMDIFVGLFKPTNMLRKIVFLVALCFYGALVAQDCEAYFPMKEGAEFEMTSYDKKDKVTGKIKHKVMAYANEGSGNISCSVQQETYDDKDELVYTNDYTVQCVDGAFTLDMSLYVDSEQMSGYQDMDTEVEATNLEMPMSPVAGQDLGDGSVTVKIGTGGVNMFTLTVNVTDRKVDAIEEITTDAGTFECVKISYTVTTKMLVKVERQVIEWYAKDVGVVKSETYKKDKLEGYSVMTSFSE